jgi:signal transduction histidine kinase
VRQAGRFSVAARPRRITSLCARAAIFVACLTTLGVVGATEALLPDNPTLGGFLLLVVLLATWSLPSAMSLVVVVLALGVAPITAYANVVDRPTATFQFIAIAVAALLAEMMVRGLIAREHEQEINAERLRRFTLDAAHELRNPLAALTSDLETTLLRPRSNEELTDTVGKALKNTERLSRIAESLLAISRGDAGTLLTDSHRVQLSDVIEEGCARWAAHASKLGVELAHTMDGDGEVDGDELLLGRVVDNLIDNAIRHALVNGWVTVALKPLPALRQWELSVSDTGPGIPAELQDRLFERFSRGDSSRSRQTGGAGLGLALCRSIVEAHGGSIRLDRGAQTGTRIVVELPYAHLSHDDEAASDARPEMRLAHGRVRP